MPLILGACAQISDKFAPSESPTRLSDKADAVESEDADFPNLASVPDQPPDVSAPDLRATVKEGLVADRANAEYTDEVLRPGGTAARLEETPVPRAFSIMTGPGSDATASVEQNPASPDPASPEPAPPAPPANLSAALPSEPAPGVAAADIAPSPPALESAPLPDIADLPAAPAAELLEPVEPATTPAPDTAAEVPPAESGTDRAIVEGSGEESGLGSQLAGPEAEIAALPPGGVADAGTQILFGEGSADLSTTAQSELSALADQLLQDEDARVQLLAYASGDQETSSQARRLSLSRAVAVRRFLIDQGVSSTRMDVRALGNQAEEAPADRVDILVADR